MATPYALNPLEQMFWDGFQSDPTLKKLYGPFFDWNPEPQGFPYAAITPVASRQAIYVMNATDVIDRPARQFNLWHDANSRGPLLGMVKAIQGLYERKSNLPMGCGQLCLSSLPLMEWQIKFVRADKALLNVDCWWAFCQYQFQVERKVGT